jgi:HSP20 family protein
MSDQELQVSDKQEVQKEQGELTHQGVYFTPAVDIYETAQELVLLADMPGVEPGGVDIDLKEDTLSIIGRVDAPEPSGRNLLTEYRVGSYFRNFRVTDMVDREGITASLKDGVLKLTLPKAAKAVPKKIAISTE